MADMSYLVSDNIYRSIFVDLACLLTRFAV
jgi:hypothetical protein